MATYKGKFTPKYPEKYKGNLKNITYRSSWERILMNYLDNSPAVLAWNSEGVVIPYISPVDNKRHRYFVDFWVRLKSSDGTIVEKMIEVKPHKETKPPRKSKNRRRYLEECKTFAVNQAKWAAAKKVAERNGIEFIIMTEYELGLKTRNAKI
jgi:hypothetical protein